MNSLPAFIKLNSQPNQLTALEIKQQADYQPLLGIWLIDIAFICNWIESPPSGLLWDIFGDSDYRYLTGLPQLECVCPDSADDVEDVDSRIDAFLAGKAAGISMGGATTLDDRPRPALQERKALLKKELLRRRKVLFSQTIDGSLSLFQNVERLGRLLRLDDTDLAILTFTACLKCIRRFGDALSAGQYKMSDGTFASVLARLFGQSDEQIRHALGRNSILFTSGLIEVDHDECDFSNKVSMMRSLQFAIFDVFSSDEALSCQVLRKASPGNLNLQDFQHVANDLALLKDYLAAAIQQRTCGVNVLIYGPPGCGKTELAKVLAMDLSVPLYEIAFTDEDGAPSVGTQRLQNFKFCQRALCDRGHALLMFDEMEDVFAEPTNFDLFSQLNRHHGRQEGKAWFNRALEENPVPTLWITNDADIDEAYLRRFDYSLAMRIPPRIVRERIATMHLGSLAVTPDQLAPLAALDDLLPAQLERAARVAKLSTPNDPQLAWQRVEMTLCRSRELLGQQRSSLRPSVRTAYSLDFLNTDANVSAILQGLQRMPRGSFLLYGPSGSGKSLLARYVADTLGKSCLQKRASDLLDKYVGGTEKRIALMFEQARSEDAILILDEADSFLADRNGAVRSWEITQTNEFLTQLESFEGIFFATTNFMEKLDTAMWRRFNHKICFNYLSAQQCWNLFQQEAKRLGIQDDILIPMQYRITRLDQLTPGDFAAVLKALTYTNEQPSANDLLEGLESEVKIKRQGRSSIGFL